MNHESQREDDRPLSNERSAEIEQRLRGLHPRAVAFDAEQLLELSQSRDEVSPTETGLARPRPWLHLPTALVSGAGGALVGAVVMAIVLMPSQSDGLSSDVRALPPIPSPDAAILASDNATRTERNAAETNRPRWSDQEVLVMGWLTTCGHDSVSPPSVAAWRASARFSGRLGSDSAAPAAIEDKPIDVVSPQWEAIPDTAPQRPNAGDLFREILGVHQGHG